MSAPVLLNRLGKEGLNFLRDVSLSNQYLVEFSLKKDLLNFLGTFNYIKKGNYGAQEYGLLCSDTSLPGSTYATSEVKDNFMGVTQEFAHTRLYTDIDMTFYVDRQYHILQLFQGWMDFISGAEGSVAKEASHNSSNPGFYRRFRYPDTYKTKITIGKFERDYGLNSPPTNNNSRSYILINAFPKSISAIPVSYGPADILKLTVTFNYDRFIINKEDGFKDSSSSTSATPKGPEQEGAPVLDALGNPLVKPSWYKGTFEDYQRDYNSGVDQGAERIRSARIQKESALPGPRSNKPWDR
jgi:hypothetical protein